MRKPSHREWSTRCPDVRAIRYMYGRRWQHSRNTQPRKQWHHRRAHGRAYRLGMWIRTSTLSTSPKPDASPCPPRRMAFKAMCPHSPISPKCLNAHDTATCTGHASLRGPQPATLAGAAERGLTSFLRGRRERRTINSMKDTAPRSIVGNGPRLVGAAAQVLYQKLRPSLWQSSNIAFREHADERWSMVVRHIKIGPSCPIT